MEKKLKIDIISDVVCPWCTIGYKRLEKAISELDVSDKIEIEWQPFELNPRMPVEGENIIEHLSNKYGANIEEQRQSQERMATYGAELGFTFDYFDEMRIVNTRDAHILLEYAKEEGKQTDLKMRLVSAFFSERKDVSDREVLLQEAQSVGLNAEEVLNRLDDEGARNRVIDKEGYWHNRGVASVPTIVFDNQSAVTGAQPVEVFKQVLTQMLEEKA